MALYTTYLRRTLTSLEHALIKLHESDPKSIEYDIFRNAAVKSFELSLETAGKLLKKTLNSYFATSKEVDRLAYKDLFRFAAKYVLISPECSARWLNYRDNRNNTAHDYGDNFAEHTLKLLPQFIEDATNLATMIDREALKVTDDDTSF